MLFQVSFISVVPSLLLPSTSTSRESSEFRPAELGGLIQRGRARAGHSPSDETDAPQHVELAPLLTAVAFDPACRHAPRLAWAALVRLTSADRW